MDTTKNDDAVTENAGFIDYAEVIDNNWLLLVNHLQLDRHHLFSYLRSKGIVDEEDVEDEGVDEHQVEEEEEAEQ